MKPPSWKLDGFETDVEASGRRVAYGQNVPEARPFLNQKHRQRLYFLGGSQHVFDMMGRTSTQDGESRARRPMKRDSRDRPWPL